VDDKYKHRVAEFRRYLSSKGVQNRPIISGNFARQPVFANYGIDLNPEAYPGAEQVHLYSFYIGLPCDRVYHNDEFRNVLDVLLADEFWYKRDV
jgi:CDP-6-deoxy-D-xylo-4-hexulose-3-dehydrase